MGLLSDHVSRQTSPRTGSKYVACWRRSHDGAMPRHLATLWSKRPEFEGPEVCTHRPKQEVVSQKPPSPRQANTAAAWCRAASVDAWMPSDSTLPVIGTLPHHFAESGRLARNSQHFGHQASESHFKASGMLQDAAIVAKCNTCNRNQSIRELRKGLFFRGGRRVAGIDFTSKSFRTAFQTIYDLTDIRAAGDCRWDIIQISDNPRHAPSVQC